MLRGQKVRKVTLHLLVSTSSYVTQGERSHRQCDYLCRAPHAYRAQAPGVVLRATLNQRRVADGAAVVHLAAAAGDAELLRQLAAAGADLHAEAQARPRPLPLTAPCHNGFPDSRRHALRVFPRWPNDAAAARCNFRLLSMSRVTPSLPHRR